MDLFCGLDCGGTKTLCILADEHGKVVGTGNGGPSNYLFCSESLARESIKGSIQKAFHDAALENCRLKCAYAASSAVEVYHGERHIPFLSTCIDSEKLYANSDAVPVWFAGAGKDAAIVVISGTGSVTYAFWDKGYVKAGGWGSLLGDEGSGYDIGRRAINAATRAQDGRSGDTRILQAVCQHFGVKGLRDIRVLLREGDQRSLIASAAQCVCELYDCGDPAAIGILQYAAEELALAVKAAAGMAAFTGPVPLIVSGSLLRPGRPLHALLLRQLRGAGYISRICASRIPAAAAAAAMALYESGMEQSAARLLGEYEAGGMPGKELGSMSESTADSTSGEAVDSTPKKAGNMSERATDSTPEEAAEHMPKETADTPGEAGSMPAEADCIPGEGVNRTSVEEEDSR